MSIHTDDGVVFRVECEVMGDEIITDYDTKYGIVTEYLYTKKGRTERSFDLKHRIVNSKKAELGKMYRCKFVNKDIIILL